MQTTRDIFLEMTGQPLDSERRLDLPLSPRLLVSPAPEPSIALRQRMQANSERMTQKFKRTYADGRYWSWVKDHIDCLDFAFKDHTSFGEFSQKSTVALQRHFDAPPSDWLN